MAAVDDPRHRRDHHRTRTVEPGRRPQRPPEAGVSAGDEILQVRDLHVEIPTRRSVVRAVDGASFSVRQGESFGLVGERGSGKTITLRAILRGLPGRGTVTRREIRLTGPELTALSHS